MSHFAKVEDSMVTAVIVAEQDFIDTLEGTWIKTSYNTSHGKHPSNLPLRKNFAGVGHTYDQTRDAFYNQQPYPSWILNEDSCVWEAPVTMPDDGKMYEWDEATLSWKEV
jgi:hypothetical protein